MKKQDLEELSVVAYERRSKMWTRFNYGDWWIAIGVYLVFCSMAFVIF